MGASARCPTGVLFSKEVDLDLVLMFILLFVAMLFVPMIAQGQVACFDYGSTISCDGPRGNTSITEFSRGQGVIQTERETIPYTIIGQDNNSRSSYSRQPIEPLERLPSSSSYGSSSYDTTTFEERQAIRESGRIPY